MWKRKQRLFVLKDTIASLPLFRVSYGKRGTVSSPRKDNWEQVKRTCVMGSWSVWCGVWLPCLWDACIIHCVQWLNDQLTNFILKPTVYLCLLMPCATKIDRHFLFFFLFYFGLSCIFSIVFLYLIPTAVLKKLKVPFLSDAIFSVTNLWLNVQALVTERVRK